MQLTLELVRDAVSTYVQSNLISKSGSFTATTDNIAELVDKIARTYTIDGDYLDKLPELEGDDLEYAKTLEEYFTNLIVPQAFDSTGANTLNRHDVSFMPNSYSYSLGRKTIPLSVPYGNLERAFHSQEEFADVIAVIIKRLYDSYNVWKYGVKKQLLGDYAGKAITAMATTATFSISTAYPVGTLLYKSGTGVAIVVKAIKSTDYGSGKTLIDVIDGGHAVLLDLVSELAVPTDEATGEAFIEDVKKVAESAQFVSEGNSLNGNTLGVSPAGLKLYIKKGIRPSLQVKTLAGAFNKDELAFDVETKVVDDFGDASSDIYAVLVDPRGVKFHNDYRKVNEQLNAEGDFMNYFMHHESTCAASRNTFLHVWKKP